MRIFLLVLALFFVGCGYKPASHMAKSVLGEKIYVDVEISIQDPQNSVLIKDAFKEAIVNRLNLHVVSKEEAQTLVSAKINSVSFSPIIYDADGYVTAYKTRVILGLDIIYEDGTKDFMNVSGNYDFTIEANSVISDTKRFEAIKYASEDALDEFVAAVSIKGIRKDVKHNQ